MQTRKQAAMMKVVLKKIKYMLPKYLRVSYAVILVKLSLTAS